MPVKIDGILDEQVWATNGEVMDFFQYFPFDTAKSKSQTKVWMAYDRNYLYLAARMNSGNQTDYVSKSLKRDYLGDNLDAFTLILDPFQDKTNGVFFGVNPFNVQREGLISNGGALPADFDLSWDNKWYSAVTRQDHYWTAEIAIPFKTLRFNSKSKVWGVNFLRVDAKNNERSVWSRVPRQFEMFNLGFTGELVFDSSFSSPGSNISIIPFAATNVSKNYVNGGWRNTKITYGGDVKVGVTSSLNLDLTVNPDFSQVEVDNQQTNLDRFELFFPEKRQFFLENADLFSNFGFSNARPFFSRRIGIGFDTASRQNVQNRIIAGARLSGRLNKDWRIGVLNMQTEQDQSKNQEGSNFTTAAVQRRVFGRSSISAIFVNKENFNGRSIDVGNPADGSYNRLLGLEYNLASPDGKWTGKAYYHRTFSAKEKVEAYSHGATLSYSTLKYFASWTQQLIGDGYDAKVGFVPRVGFNRVNPVIGYNLYRQSRLINRYQFSISNNWIWNQTWGVTDYNLSAAFTVNFQNSAVYNFSLLSNYVKLFSYFNPTGSTGRLFSPGQHFSQTGFLTSFQTNQRNPFSTLVQLISGRFYNGNLMQLSGNFNYRYRQYAVFGFTYAINRIQLSDGFKGATLYLLGASIDLTLSNALFWTTYVQYNSQIKNLNINSRFQWRFKPASDLFVVYTDNYYPDHLKIKNRAVVLKFTYWMNL